MKHFFLGILFSHILTFAASDFSDFDSYQGRMTRSEIEEKLGVFLQKDGDAGSYFTLDDHAFTLYTASETEKERAVEYSLTLASQKMDKAVQPEGRKDLVGVKIALDPGHLGGDYARLEERYIDIPPSLERKELIQFDEGSLCFLTAVYLKLLLEKEGAVVMITRDQIGKGVYEEDFFDWLKKNPQLWLGEVSLNKIYARYYNPLDLLARAKKINEFSPDLTVVIHYNSQDPEAGKSSNHHVAAQNYNMVFIPGAFCRNELADRETRYEFLRLLLREDVKESAVLSRKILEQFSQYLEVPVITKNDGAHYLDRVCLKIYEGVYARNLALTRLIHGPICYGETLIQNNVDECVNLSRQDFVIDGRPCSSRLKQVAEAYYEGIKNYLLKSE